MLTTKISAPILARLAQIGALTFFRGLCFYWMLDIVARHSFPGKDMFKTLEKDKRPYFASNLGSLGPNSGQEIFFTQPVVRYCPKYYHMDYKN